MLSKIKNRQPIAKNQIVSIILLEKDFTTKLIDLFIK